MSSKKGQTISLGDFMFPVMELMSLLFAKVIEGAIMLISYGLERGLKYSGKQKITKIEKSDFKKKKEVVDFDSIGYSLTKKREVKGKEIDKSKHSLVVGSSGSGKTCTLETLMFSDMRQGKSVVYIDPKADNESLERFIDLCRLNKKEYLIFSEHYNKDGKISINPVMEGSVNHIVDRVFKSFTWSEEFYANKCQQALKKAVKSLKSKSSVVSLKSIYEEIILLCESKEKDEKLNRSDIEGLITKLDNIVDSDFGAILHGDNAYSFSRLREEGKCVYIGLSVLGYSETARAIERIILGDIAYSVYSTYRSIDPRSSSELKPLGLYIDELSAIISDEFIEILNKCRGAKLEITSAFQTSDDLNKVNPNLCQQVFENTLNWFVMKQRMDDAAKMISFAIGTNTGEKKTRRVDNDQEQGSGSVRDVEELIVHPNVIKDLDVGQCVLFRQQPTQIDAMNIKYISQNIIDSNLEYFEYSNWITERKLTRVSNSAKEASKKEALYV